MRVAFAGTPPFAARILEQLLEAGHDVPLVLTQPDRPAGRGLKLTPSAVSNLAQSRSIPTAKPLSLKTPESRQPLVDARVDILAVAAYGLILPQSVLDIPRLGCLNVHASLLPRWRGAAPVQRAILAGDAETGVCIMRMEAGLDTGPVYLERRTAIEVSDNAGLLTERLAQIGGQALVETIAHLEEMSPVPQPESGVTYAAKIDKSEARIDWNRSAEEVGRQVRAFNPFPGAEARWGEESLKIWEAKIETGKGGEPGEVVGHSDGCPVIACGSGRLVITCIQRPGSKRLPSPEVLRARLMATGTRLG